MDGASALASRARLIILTIRFTRQGQCCMRFEKSFMYPIRRGRKRGVWGLHIPMAIHAALERRGDQVNIIQVNH